MSVARQRRRFIAFERQRRRSKALRARVAPMSAAHERLCARFDARGLHIWWMDLT